MEDNIQINEKTKKSDIIDAYNQLLRQVQKDKKASLKEEKEKQMELEIVKEASSNTTENLILSLSTTKQELSKLIDHIETQITQEYKKLTDIQKAIAIETKNLDEIYQIKINAQSLEALIMAQKELKLQFETQMNKQKQTWSEELEKTKQERQREEDEYEYLLKIQRRKEQDVYNLKKEKQEKDLLERELALSSKEKEYESLKKQVESFPKELEKRVQEIETNTRAEVERNYKFDKELSLKEKESESKLHEQVLKSLQNKVKEQDDIIKQLSQKTDIATQQVQTIAIKAIESSSPRTFHTNLNDATNKVVHQV